MHGFGFEEKHHQMQVYPYLLSAWLGTARHLPQRLR